MVLEYQAQFRTPPFSVRMAPFWAVLPKSLFLDCGTLAVTSDLLTYPISGTEFIGLSASWAADQYLSGFSRSPMPNLGKRLHTARAVL
jgi:hypothetical protein